MKKSALNIWVPDSASNAQYDIPVLRVDKAVQEYDENLRFGRNEETGQWCIFRLVRGENPLPILGFNEIPHPEDACKRLFQADAMRRGEEILDEMNRQNEELDKHVDAAADEANGIAAEVYEHAFRMMGKTPYLKSFRVKPGNRMGGYA